MFAGEQSRMKTVSIIVPIDKRRSAQLFTLLQMFSRSTVIPLKDITAVIPRSTFFALLYKLKLIGKILSEKHSFELFTFEKQFDFDTGKELKMMKLNAKVEISEMEGLSFVVFTKEIQ